MPFHNGAYYLFTGDTQGTHSSAGIPSLLNSPLSQPPVSGMTPAVLPFRFRPRRGSFDWRRINAVDIDLVMSQLDLDTLQEHISGVTFCSLDGVRCQRCQSAVDPALVNLLKLAQLTVEWLLHCQEVLTQSLRAMEERVAAAGRECEQLLAQQKKQEEEKEKMLTAECEQLLAQQKKQEEKEKMLTAELKHRKKIICTQQSMLAPQIIGGQKCPHCDKAFLNPSFLQNHMQRNHPGEYDIECRSDSEKRAQFQSLKLEISGLKEQVIQQQLDLQTNTAREKDLLREVDRFKAEEMARMDKKIQDSRDGMRREMELLFTQNIQTLNDQKWGSRLKEMEDHHESEKNQLQNELSRMQSVSEHQDSSQRLLQEKARRLQEAEQTIEAQREQIIKAQREQTIEAQRKQTIEAQREQTIEAQRKQTIKAQREQTIEAQRKQTIKAQREQIRNISSNPPTKIVEVPVMVSAPAPEPRPKRVVLEEPVSAPKLDPIQELSEEEKESSSFSERRPAERRPEPAPEKKPRVTTSALKMNPNIKKEIRRDLEQTLVEKLENLGVKSDQSGLKDKELRSILAKLHSKREGIAKRMPDYWPQREEIASTVEQKLAGQRRDSEPAPESQTRSRQSVQVLQIRNRSSSLPSRATQVVSGPAVKQPKTPQLAPRARTTAKPKTSTPKTAPRTFTSKIPPFSSDEDTDVEEDHHHQKHQGGKLPQPRASKASPVQSRQAQARQSVASNPQQARGSAGSEVRTAVAKMESDDDEWSDVSELQEIDPKRLQSFKDQNGNVDKRNFGKENKIHDLARKMEKQLAERTVKKPAGGVSVLPERKDEVQDFTYEDPEESSDWAVSSLEDRRETAKPAQGSGPARKSLDSPSTSVWGTSTGKGAKSGLTDAGTGSTLKSSLCSLSDISDSEDISNK